ncbi:hypothetical protein A3715_10245 [Oleiphilus sp. HI0009]|nr:hypothetical protein A3715_10245 [Oleiphilus sp. HI0009]
MTTPNDLYKMTPESISYDPSCLEGFSYSHIPEVPDGLRLFDLEDYKKIKLCYLKDFNFDHRRCWRLATVWFEEKPVMVIQNSGREGDDFSKRFITDMEAYKEMVRFIKYELEEHDTRDCVGAEEDIKGLTEFSGH